MQSKDDLNRKVRKLVAIATGLDPQWISPADQSLDIPAPPQVWVTVRVDIFGPVGLDEVRYKNGTNNLVAETVEGARLCTASIQFYRVGALDLANRFKTRVRMSTAVEYMRANDIGYVSLGAINDVTAVESEDWEERSAVQLVFHTSVQDTIDLPTYGTFDFTIYRDDPDASYHFTVTAPGEDQAQNSLTTEDGNTLTTESSDPILFD